MASDAFKCPSCSATAYRIPRMLFQRLLPGSRRFECMPCHKRYLVFMGRVFGK